jgi:hypothetical protein
MAEISNCALECAKLKQERVNSNKNMKWDRFHIVMEATKKRIASARSA